MEEYIKPLLSIGTVSGIVSAIWLLFSKIILEKEKRNINESLIKLKSEIDKQKDEHLFLFKERYKNEISAYDVIWGKLTELIIVLEQTSFLSTSYIQGIITNEDNKDALNEELESLNKLVKKKYDEAKYSYYEKKPYISENIEKYIKKSIFQSSVLMARLWSDFIMKTPGGEKENHDGYGYIEGIYHELGDNIRARYEEISRILGQ